MSVDVMKPSKYPSGSRWLPLQRAHHQTTSTVLNLKNFPVEIKGREIENGAEPSAPITKKGILTSFQTGKPMNIPDTDIVRLQHKMPLSVHLNDNSPFLVAWQM